MSRPYSESDSFTLYPSGYTGNNSYMSITNQANAYTSSSDTSNYATLTLSTNGQTGYVYFTYSIPTIPTGATITSVTCSARLRANSSNRVTNCNIQLYNGTTAQGTATSIGTLNTTSTVYNITNANAGTWTSSNISNIRLRITGTRSSGSSTSIRFYGSDLTITYSISGTEYEVSITNNSAIVTPNPSTTQYVLQGGSQEIILNGVTDPNTVTVKDNNVEVTLSQVLEIKTSNLIPSSLVSSSGTVSNSDSGLTNSSSTTYAQTGGQSGQYLIYSFDVSSIPSNASIISVECTAKAQHTHSSTTYGSIQLYSGSTAKGSASTFRTATTMDLNCGNWTRSELSNIRIRIGNTYTGGTTSYYTRFYGADLTITYTVPGNYCYGYTISNISTDHVIVISDAASAKAYIKINGSWVQASKIYKKVNGSWVEQSDLSNLFDSDKIYIKV